METHTIEYKNHYEGDHYIFHLIHSIKVREDFVISDFNRYPSSYSFTLKNGDDEYSIIVFFSNVKYIEYMQIIDA